MAKMHEPTNLHPSFSKMKPKFQANEQSDAITVAGNKEGIEKALHELRIISDEQSKQAYERIEIPKIYHPFIQVISIRTDSRSVLN